MHAAKCDYFEHRVIADDQCCYYLSKSCSNEHSIAANRTTDKTRAPRTGCNKHTINISQINKLQIIKHAFFYHRIYKRIRLMSHEARKSRQYLSKKYSV